MRAVTLYTAAAYDARGQTSQTLGLAVCFSKSVVAEIKARFALPKAEETVA